MDTILKATDITKKYKMGEIEVNALKDVNFDIKDGELIVILGPSGSGKSTLLNIIGGIDKPTTGNIFYNNVDISKYNDKKLTIYRKNAIGFIFQFYNLIPNLNVLENIELSSNLSDKSIDIASIIDNVGLSKRKNNFPSQLSGGEQQRVAIARAIVKNPNILLCDEPTGALDFSTSIDVLKLLCKFNKQYKKTIIIITHNNVIAEIADRIFYVKDGSITKIKNNIKPSNPEELIW